jgi:hypothetical protein
LYVGITWTIVFRRISFLACKRNLGPVWQPTSLPFSYFFFFTSPKNKIKLKNQLENILTFFTFYITSINFYYYLNFFFKKKKRKRKKGTTIQIFFSTFSYIFFLFYISHQSLFIITKKKKNSPILFFSFFFYMFTQEGGWRIQTSDLRFMRRGPQPIELPLGHEFPPYLRGRGCQTRP